MNRRILAVLATVLMAVAMFAPVSGAHQLVKNPRPYYIECSTTIWATRGSGNGPFSVDGVNLTLYLKVLEDARDFSYCGEMYGWAHYSENSGTCNATVNVQVKNFWTGDTWGNHGTSAGGCGATGDAFSNTVSPGDSCVNSLFAGVGWIGSDSGNSVASHYYNEC